MLHGIPLGWTLIGIYKQKICEGVAQQIVKNDKYPRWY